MWRIEEHRRVDKQVAAAPVEILKRYEKWKDIASMSGPWDYASSKGFTMRAWQASGKAFVPPVWEINGA
jgi:hypothetical protein